MRPPDHGSDAPEPAPVDAPRPLGLRLVAGGAAVEALLLVVMAVVVALELLRGGSASIGVSVFLVLFFLGIAWVLVAATRVLWAGRRGGRAPLVVWQLLQGVVGVSLLAGGATWAVTSGVVLILLSASVLVTLLTRNVVEATSG